jgi:lipopolysaccharide cholinephosphotransferase
MRTGIFLDVFPLDAVPDFPPLRGIFSFWCFLLRKLLYAEAGTVTGRTAPLRMWFRLLNLVPHRSVFKRIESLAARCNRSKTALVRIYMFPPPAGRYGYLRKWYEELEEIEFEGMRFPGIRDFDAYLSYKFGDYMTLPPEDQRHCHPVSHFKLPLTEGE